MDKIFPDDLITIIDDYALEENLRKSSKYLKKLLPYDEYKYTTILVYNHEKYKDNLKYYKNLKRLNCSDTQITEIPKELTNLQKLDCQFTQITEIPNRLTNLQILDCSGTQITKIPKELNCNIIR